MAFRSASLRKMVDLPRDHATPHPARAGAAVAIGAVGLGVVVASVLLPFRNEGATWFAIGLHLAVAAAVLALIGAHYPHRRFGAANTVTLLRAGGVAVFAGFAAEPAAILSTGPLAVFGAALLLLALDGIDGLLARRQGLVTGFGARFDMEVDALFILILATIAFGLGKADAWVLGLGLLRYGFLAGGQVWPWLEAPLPPSLRRKAICVLQIAVLALLLLPHLAPPVSGLVAAVAFVLLLWSFAVDIRWLHRHRAISAQ